MRLKWMHTFLTLSALPALLVLGSGVHHSPAGRAGGASPPEKAAQATHQQTQSDRFRFGGRRGRGYWNRVPPRFPDPDQIDDGSFSFARILYQSIRDEPLGHGWNTDSPPSS